jgi:uncharacterized protein YbbC (DUF1343 family)
MAVRFGIDKIISSNPIWKSDRIGFLTNDAAKTNKGIASRKALLEAGFNITVLFSPEHGIDTNGADGAKMEDGKDPITGLSIISLYGEKFMPSQADLLNVDILLFDIPDAGTRFYTYLWSLTYFIEAAAKHNKKIIVLDRPNPLGGNFALAEGPYLDASEASFIGRFNMPVKHQSTLGELALYFNKTQNWNANLEVVKCENWKRNDLFFEWNLPWIKTSPAIQSFEACLLYPGLCFFEATNVSIGRSTKYSFEWIGATWFNLPALAMVWQNILREDIKIETLKLPISSNDEIIETKGISIKIIDPYNYDSVLNGLLLLKIIKDIHPQDFKWSNYPTIANPSGTNHLSLLLGISNAEAIFDLPLQNWLQQIGKLLRVEDWKKIIEPYLLY